MHDLVRGLGLTQEELAQVKSQLTQAERGSHSQAKFTSIREQLQEISVELRVIQDRHDHVQVSTQKMGRAG